MSQPGGSTDAFADLVEESLDEAAFLWQRWESELTSPTRNLNEVWSWTEDRLVGALDGVRAAGAGLVDLASAGLGSEDHPRVVACAALLASSPEPAAAAAVAEAVSSAEDDKLGAIVRGLEVFGHGPSLRAAAEALRARGALGVLCTLKAFHRARMGDELVRALESADAVTQALAVRSAAHVTSREFDDAISGLLQSGQPQVRVAAVDTGLRRGLPHAWPAAVRLAKSGDLTEAPLLTWIAMLGSPDDQEIIFSALRVPELQRAGVWALGHIGTTRAVEACLAGMRHEAAARACGEAYCWMTGADLERDSLAVREEPPDPPSFEDEDLDANLVPSPADLWPLPDPEAIKEDWAARSASFSPELRHIHGRPVTPDWLVSMVERGPMLRRPDLVMELAARSRGAFDVETRALTSRQRRMFESSRAAVAAAGER